MCGEYFGGHEMGWQAIQKHRYAIGSMVCYKDACNRAAIEYNRIAQAVHDEQEAYVLREW